MQKIKSYLNKIFSSILFLGSIVLFISCNNEGKTGAIKLFSRLDNEMIGLDFKNTINDTADLTMYDSDLIYSGAGLSVGDINNDGLPDVFLVGNQTLSKIYLNKGDFKFEDITARSGIVTKGWCAGTTMADVNGDGFLDIYVCVSGFKQEEDKRNMLFINNGDLTFTESAAKYGIDDNGASSSASFFDYDNDGDLDLFVVNYPDDIRNTFKIPFYLDKSLTDTLNCNQLYENKGDHFENVTSRSKIGYKNADSFQASIADINNDGYLDIYINNDLLQPDFLFINNGDRTFTETLNQHVNSVPMFSMGSTFADFNNDGLLDIITSEMMPPEHLRRKNNMPHPDVEFYDYVVNKTFNSRQHSRNMLQIQNPDGTFSEVGEMANISRTDWSWATLGCDYDNDGFQDMLITNGVKRDVFDQTYLSLAFEGKEHVDFKYSHDGKDLIKKMPVHLLENYIFRNMGDLSFEHMTDDWGLTGKAASQGASYGDFNNDGYPDIIISNTDSFAFVYKNNGKLVKGNNFMKISFRGEDKNLFGLGTKVKLYYHGKMQYQQLQNGQGWQSSSEPVIYFGLGKVDKIDSIEVTWLNGKQQKVYNSGVNKHLVFKQENAKYYPKVKASPNDNTIFKETTIFAEPFVHKEKEFIDFRRDKLIPKMISREGPGMAVGDVNKDGLEDVFIGGASGQSAQLYLQQKDASFLRMSGQPWQSDSTYEDMSVAFVDINGDGYQDIYVSSGSNEFSQKSPWLKDRVYINKGGKEFVRKDDVIRSNIIGSKSIVKPIDIDKDGDMDLFVGGRVNNELYPTAPNSYLLINEKGYLYDKTAEWCPELSNIGMITDAKFTDLNGDGSVDCVLSGEWMPISIFIQSNKKLVNKTRQYGLNETNGWWSSLVLTDINNDGEMDIIAGNYGFNTILKASKKEPVICYFGDFDKNGISEQLLSHYRFGILAPYADRDLILRSIPTLTNKFLTYEAYGRADINDILTSKQRDEAQLFKAYTFASTAFISENGKYKQMPLPNEAQVAPVYGMVAFDYNRDGIQDLFLTGNSYSSGYEDGPMAAMRGLILKGNGDGTFKPLRYDVTGISMNTDSKSAGMVYLQAKKRYALLVGVNNGVLRTYLGPTGLAIEPETRQLGTGYLFNYMPPR